MAPVDDNTFAMVGLVVVIFIMWFMFAVGFLIGWLLF